MSASASGDWLLVIDLQPAFSHPESAWFTPTLPDVSGRIEVLVERFGPRVTFTRFIPPATPFGSWRNYYGKWPFALRAESAWLWALDARWAGQPTLDTHTFSKWLPKLRAICGEREVVLCGVSTDCCVLMTALAAVDDGAQVRVVADACAARTSQAHDRALEIMAARAPQLRITTVAEELAWPT
jgi:nicotinamidase-related amidase